MNQIERNVLPAVGPRFFRANDGTVMFEFTVDPNNVIGPRPATRREQEQHAGTWAAFAEAEGIGALDRDADGTDGGSLPKAPRPAAEAFADQRRDDDAKARFAESQAEVTATQVPPRSPKRSYTRRRG